MDMNPPTTPPGWPPLNSGFEPVVPDQQPESQPRPSFWRLNLFPFSFNVSDLMHRPFSLNWRDALLFPLAVALLDVCLYSGGGLSGYGVVFLLFPLLIVFGCRKSKIKFRAVFILSCLALLGLDLIWSGDLGDILAGCFLIVALSMTLNWLKPFMLESSLYLANCVPAGLLSMIHLIRKSKLARLRITRNALGVFVPLLVFLIFGYIFTMANPSLQELAVSYIDSIARFFFNSPITIGRILFWACVLWLTAGLIRPWIHKDYEKRIFGLPEKQSIDDLPLSEKYVFLIARNTLIAVVSFFALYLCYEIYSLMFIGLPQGYSHSRYCHQGAAWLTLALFTATMILGMIFRGSLLKHANVHALQCLTWCWSAENFILAFCIIGRLMMYINYNGMSRMRVVAICGIIAVLLGFLLVAWKVLRGKTLLWLIRRDLWALAMVVFIYIILPVDWIITRYNVAQIMSGNALPAVQLVAHPIREEGLPCLLPLIKCENTDIRNGAAAMLCQKQIELEATIAGKKHWTEFQWSENRALSILRKHQQNWGRYFNAELRINDLNRFERYGMQWY
ncbi:DUF4173 domain-containing protein [Candidatus Sumerlaeota bacterium]|nr:DUF4173 domain-containing protein [Candidatus Sumerlaeota bacterium]